MTTLAVETPSRGSPLDVLDLRPRKRDAALAALLDCAAACAALRDPGLVLNLLLARERSCPAVLACGVAVPHARSLCVLRPHVLLGRSARGISWPGADAPVALVVLVLDPGDAGAALHEARVARVAAALRVQRTRARVLAAADVPAARLALADVFA